MRKKERNKLILERLEETYKGRERLATIQPRLNSWWRSSFLPSARMNGSILLLSAFFPKYNTPEKLGALTLEQMETLIHDCGLYHSKARNILLRAENSSMTSILKFPRR